MSLNRTFLSLISLCQRAGKLVSGEDSVLIAIKNGSALLVIVADDASENTKYKFLNKAEYYKVKAVSIGTREELNQASGKFNRTVFAVTDENFAGRMLKEIDSINGGGLFV